MHFAVLPSEPAMSPRNGLTTMFVSSLKLKPPSTSVSCTEISPRTSRSESDLSRVHDTFLTSEQTGSRFLVCDAGGSTIDTIAYVVRSCQPRLELEEVKASGCKRALYNPFISDLTLVYNQVCKQEAYSSIKKHSGSSAICSPKRKSRRMRWKAGCALPKRNSSAR